MNNLEELFIANAELAAELLQHMADNEIDSDYFAVVTDSPNCGREVQSEHSVTEVALMAAGIIEQLIAQLKAAQKEVSAANEKLSKPVVLPEVVVVNISGKYPIEVMYASKVKTFLKAAGFTAEGE
ncbi:hypothetical protein ACVT81_004408 [Yersinia enterocolitica]